MSRAALAGALLLALASGTACRTPLPAAFPLPLPEEDARAQALLADLVQGAEQRRGLRGRARVAIEGQRGASFAKQIVLLEKPARLRVEVLGLLGQRVAVLATDGAAYALYRAETGGRIDRGDVHPGILLEVAGIPLVPEDAVAILLGAPLHAGGGGIRPAGASRNAEGAVRVRLDGPDGAPARSLDFDAEGRLLAYHLHAPDGTPLLQVAYADYREVGSEPFAHRVTLAFPYAELKAEVSFRSVELNPELAPELFRLDLPGREEA